VNVLALLADDGWHDRMMNGNGGGWWWLGMLMMLVVVAVLVFLIVLAVRASHLPAGPPAHHDEGRTARAIAMERYARGEITAEEYDALVQRLR
jgi:uncharacterized membrane protein